MALTARSIQTAIVTALAQSKDIAVQCLSYFGEVHQVNSGGSGRQGQSEAPSFSVVAWSRSAGEDDVERVLEFSLLLSITDASTASTTNSITITEVWEAETEYEVDDIVKNDGNLYICVTAGESAVVDGPEGEESGIEDGTVVWNFVIEGSSLVIDIINYNGLQKLEILLELAAAEILAISSEIMISELNYSFEPLEYYPLFVGGLDFTVTFPVLIGGYEPTLT